MERGASKPRWKLLTHSTVLTSTSGGSAIFSCVWRNSFPWVGMEVLAAIPLASWQLSPLSWHSSQPIVLALRLLLTGTLGWWRNLRGGSCFSGSGGSVKANLTWIVPGSVPVWTVNCECQAFPPSCSQHQCFSSFLKTLDFPGRHPKLIPFVMFP